MHASEIREEIMLLLTFVVGYSISLLVIILWKGEKLAKGVKKSARNTDTTFQELGTCSQISTYPQC